MAKQNDKLQRIINQTLCNMVNDSTGLKVEYNHKARSISVNNKPPIPFDEQQRRVFLELISL